MKPTSDHKKKETNFIRSKIGIRRKERGHLFLEGQQGENTRKSHLSG